MHIKPQCDGCYKPVYKRLALIQATDEYECYAERYVKCFWSLCDYQKSTDNFTHNHSDQVITNQPRKQELSYNDHKISVINSVLITN
ncbi:hypothetical protein K1T71_008305 [Dendrolimus kikuchii]|uniref:Uncharacterized protein n=1 Tax=Dendrolimus kikuchii TaxID=765133 RepID=A0ACC1CWP9_9NEOP|nr:hypothetical protein K1T71_008305 [Dendrolimus kikuchii]